MLVLLLLMLHSAMTGRCAGWRRAQWLAVAMRGGALRLQSGRTMWLMVRRLRV